SAHADFRSALDSTRRYRLEVLPAGVLPARWEAELGRLRTSFIRFAAEQAIRTRNKALALEALVAAEEGRLAALRTFTSRPSTARLADYQAKVQYLETLESSLLAQESSAETRTQAARLRQEILDLESRLALEGEAWLPPYDPVALACRKLADAPPSSTTFSIFLDSPNSYLWELRKDEIRLVRLADRAAIEQAARAFREGIESNDARAMEFGLTLYNQLFGEISPAARTSHVWTLILDGNLFEVPWAALPVSPRRLFLAEQHALRTAPSFFVSADRCSVSGRFVGVGDPIYNRADRRQPPCGQPKLELARLVGSGVEVESCRRAWKAEGVVLRGAEATAARLVREMQQPVAALHFATHFVRSPQDASRTLVALSLAPEADGPELLGPERILAMGLRTDVVVLSGCQS
ncbi:MAG: CHAT domain-containing protein, partial [Gemmatales bacterium]|nr:CHAT domain-containing protein [Gemmatales bacterium]